ncbi:MAG: 4Fe-4S dicluster domain-containing protein [Pyramidobacter sp.]|nr:4Fe-4S dicluster domain-containing protein [Pyramidobacter sp.]
MQGELIARAKKMLADGTVNRVLGWRRGQFAYDVTPDVFTTAEDLEKNFVWNAFCGANLSKYLIAESAKEGKVAVFLKPCDTYSFNQLCTEHRLHRENIYVIGIPCRGTVSIDGLRERGVEGVISAEAKDGKLLVETIYGNEEYPLADVLPERCANCKSWKHAAADELIGEEGEAPESHRFDEVARIEKMTPEERFAFWRSHLSRCIRCNACRNVCPACSCEKCVFDNPNSGVQNRAAADDFEENMFHIIRAFHVAGRCTDCGECSRVCPEHIPLHLLNRKFIKDYNALYGDFTAGAEVGQMSPVADFTTDRDAEPDIVRKGGLRG